MNSYVKRNNKNLPAITKQPNIRRKRRRSKRHEKETHTTAYKNKDEYKQVHLLTWLSAWSQINSCFELETLLTHTRIFTKLCAITIIQLLRYTQNMFCMVQIFLPYDFFFLLFYYYSLCFWFWIWCSCFSSEFSCFVVANTIRHVNMKISWAHVTTRAVRCFCYFVHYFLSISNLCRLMRLIIHTNKVSLVDLLIRLFFIWEWFSSVECLWMLNLALHRSRTKTKQNY